MGDKPVGILDPTSARLKHNNQDIYIKKVIIIKIIKLIKNRKMSLLPLSSKCSPRGITRSGSPLKFIPTYGQSSATMSW